MGSYQPMEVAVAAVRDRDTVGVGLGPAQPSSFLHALGSRSYEQLDIFGALLVDLYAVMTAPGVHHYSGFFGPAERFLIASGADIQFVPADFRRFAPIMERLCPRVMAVMAAEPDEDGWLSLSLHNGATYAELVRCAADPDRVLIVETHEDCPRTHGLMPDHPNRLHLDQMDILVHAERPIFTLEDPPPSDVERAIAANARPFVTDGCTLQTGIGSIPSTLVGILAEEATGGNYGIHSEMFTDGLMRLHQSGKVTNANKGQFEGYSVTTFAAGTLELYRWLDDNTDVRFLPVHLVNSPHVIAGNHNMVSLNGGLMVDLYGQTVADTIGGTQYSGIGGHEDFIAQSGLELSDRSLVCLPSTATVHGEVVSRIVPQMAAGTVVTTPRHQMDVVVTEHGVAELRGATVRQRAQALAEIAAPEFRDELREAAERL